MDFSCTFQMKISSSKSESESTTSFSHFSISSLSLFSADSRSWSYVSVVYSGSITGLDLSSYRL